MSIETVVEIETVVDDLTAHEFDICCELGTDGVDDDCDRPARWIMHRKPCCPAKMYPALACDQCKDYRLESFHSVMCTTCGHLTPHAPDAYSLIELIKKS